MCVRLRSCARRLVNQSCLSSEKFSGPWWTCGSPSSCSCCWPRECWEPMIRDHAICRIIHAYENDPLIEALAHISSPMPPVRASLVKCDLLQRALGRPNREQIVSTRPEDLTTLEALDLANGAALSNALVTGAKRLAARKWDSPDALVAWLYTFAIARPPSPDELASARELLGATAGENGVQDLLWAVCMLPEFQIVR